MRKYPLRRRPLGRPPASKLPLGGGEAPRYAASRNMFRFEVLLTVSFFRHLIMDELICHCLCEDYFYPDCRKTDRQASSGLKMNKLIYPRTKKRRFESAGDFSVENVNESAHVKKQQSDAQLWPFLWLPTQARTVL